MNVERITIAPEQGAGPSTLLDGEFEEGSEGVVLYRVYLNVCQAVSGVKMRMQKLVCLGSYVLFLAIRRRCILL